MRPALPVLPCVQFVLMSLLNRYQWSDNVANADGEITVQAGADLDLAELMLKL